MLGGSREAEKPKEKKKRKKKKKERKEGWSWQFGFTIQHADFMGFTQEIWMYNKVLDQNSFWFAGKQMVIFHIAIEHHHCSSRWIIYNFLVSGKVKAVKAVKAKAGKELQM